MASHQSTRRRGCRPPQAARVSTNRRDPGQLDLHDGWLCPQQLLQRHPDPPGPSDAAFYRVLGQLHPYQESVHWQYLFRVIRALVAEFCPPRPAHHRAIWREVAEHCLPLALLWAIQSYRGYDRPFPLVIPELIRVTGFADPEPGRTIQPKSLERAFRENVIAGRLELFFPVVPSPAIKVDGRPSCYYCNPGYDELEHWFKARTAVPVIQRLIRQGPPRRTPVAALSYRVGPACGRQAVSFQQAAKLYRKARTEAEDRAVAAAGERQAEDSRWWQEAMARAEQREDQLDDDVVESPRRRRPWRQPRSKQPERFEDWSPAQAADDLQYDPLELYENQNAEIGRQWRQQQVEEHQRQQAIRDEQVERNWLARGGDRHPGYQEHLESLENPYFRWAVAWIEQEPEAIGWLGGSLRPAEPAEDVTPAPTSPRPTRPVRTTTAMAALPDLADRVAEPGKMRGLDDRHRNAFSYLDLLVTKDRAAVERPKPGRDTGLLRRPSFGRQTTTTLRARETLYRQAGGGALAGSLNPATHSSHGAAPRASTTTSESRGVQDLESRFLRRFSCAGQEFLKDQPELINQVAGLNGHRPTAVASKLPATRPLDPHRLRLRKGSVLQGTPDSTNPSARPEQTGHGPYAAGASSSAMAWPLTSTETRLVTANGVGEGPATQCQRCGPAFLGAPSQPAHRHPGSVRGNRDQRNSSRTIAAATTGPQVIAITPGSS